jgi:hypothetical protein
MDAVSSIRAVLQRRKPARIPFAPNEELLARGQLSRELRNRGMGMCTAWTPTYWSGWPNVRFKSRIVDEMTITTWETPVGQVSSHRPLDIPSSSSTDRLRKERPRIETIEDLEPTIYAIQDEVFYPDPVQYNYLTYDFGQDCLIKVAGPSAPYEASWSYYAGQGEGLQGWLSVQRDHPDRFARLLEVLEERESRLWEVIAHAPGDVMCLRGLSDRCTPEAFRKHVLPFLSKYASLIRAQGKAACLKTTATRLRALKELIAQTGVDVIDGFAPPPVGDLSIAEARAAWGERIAVWVDLPFQVLCQGYAVAHRYALDLIESDPTRRLVLGMTTRGSAAIADRETYQAVCAGMTAVMDAVDASAR